MTDFLAVLLLAGSVASASAQNSPITFPVSLSSVNGGLATALTLEENTLTVPGTGGLTVTSRFLNGTFPGPTFRLQPGDWLNISFTNTLPNQGSPYKHNAFSAPDETNIHFHGLHVSGELPSDDAEHVVLPGEGYNYTTKLPPTHLPGTHWLHPHRHGSTTLHLGGGAVSAIIVEDPPGFLPTQVENAREILFLASQMLWGSIQDIASKSGDGLFKVTIGGNVGDIVAVNGQYKPKIVAAPGEWLRLRVIWAAWQRGALGISVPGCEMQLLAKDGIYIRDFPRPISYASIVPGGRADVMVRCMGESATYDINGIASIETSAGPVDQSTALASWTPEYPPYLSDLWNVAPSQGCSCTTEVGPRGGVNGRLYGDGRFHETYLGSIAERDLKTGSHPYHQHVYPFQLISGFGPPGSYNADGDWHDTIEGGGIIRFNASEFEGKIMVHCHRLNHEDEGMMAVETVLPSDNPTCFCASVVGFPAWAIALIVVGGVLILLLVTWISVRCLKARGRCLWCPFPFTSPKDVPVIETADESQPFEDQVEPDRQA